MCTIGIVLFIGGTVEGVGSTGGLHPRPPTPPRTKETQLGCMCACVHVCMCACAYDNNGLGSLTTRVSFQLPVTSRTKMECSIIDVIFCWKRSLYSTGGQHDSPSPALPCIVCIGYMGNMGCIGYIGYECV